MLSIIVAIDEDKGIGYNNKLLCHISDDLKNFKKITLNHKIIMGRKTFESIGRPLPNRENLVLSSNKIECMNNLKWIKNIDEIKKLSYDSEEYFVIGGGMLYKELLPFCDKLYITLIHKKFKADTYFPEFENDFEILEEKLKNYDEENDLEFDYLIYMRKV